MIKDVNQKFSELGSPDSLSLSFYRKLQGLIVSALKDCISSLNVPETISDSLKGSILAVRTLTRYYRWVDSNVKNF